MPELFEVPATAKARPVGFDENEAHAARAALRRGPNHDDHEIAHLPVGDEGLLARYHIVVALADRTGPHTLQIASGAGLGHGDGANGLARHHAWQPFFLLLRSSVTEQIAATDVVMHGEVGGGAGKAGIAEFL